MRSFSTFISGADGVLWEAQSVASRIRNDKHTTLERMLVLVCPVRNLQREDPRDAEQNESKKPAQDELPWQRPYYRVVRVYAIK